MKDKVYSLRLADELREALSGWAKAEGRPLANLIERILADALVKRSAESTESGLPVTDLRHLPTAEADRATQATSAS